MSSQNPLYIVGPTDPGNPTDQGEFSLVVESGQNVPQLEIGYLAVEDSAAQTTAVARTKRVRGSTQAGVFVAWISATGDHYIFNMADVTTMTTNTAQTVQVKMDAQAQYVKAVMVNNDWVPQLQPTPADSPLAPADVQEFYEQISKIVSSTVS